MIMRKRITAFIMTLLMIFLSLPVSAAGDYNNYRDYFPFEDIPAESWYTPATEFCFVNGYMRGVGDNTFEPFTMTTREQIIMILANMSGEDITVYTECSFTDTVKGAWYYNAVAWAESKGYTNGIGGGLFGLGIKITREEAVTILDNYISSLGIEPKGDMSLDGFDDADCVSVWAIEAMDRAVGFGLIKGTDENKLEPKGLLTRSQAAQMIYNLTMNITHAYHEHEFTEPTCTEPARCICTDGIEGECELMLKPAKGHSFDTPENCESYVICNDCGELVYTPMGHDYRAATCTEPMICNKCGKSEGEALGHTVETGVCERCNAEFFADNYQKLVYYLKAKGEDKGSTKQLHVRVKYSNGDFAEQYAGYDYSNNKCYIRLLYRFAKKGDNIDIKWYFDSVSSEYIYTVDYLVDGTVMYSGSGSLNAEAFGKTTVLTLDSYEGDEVYRDALEKLCAPTIRLALDGANYLLTTKANLTIADLGFKLFSN